MFTSARHCTEYFNLRYCLYPSKQPQGIRYYCILSVRKPSLREARLLAVANVAGATLHTLTGSLPCQGSWTRVLPTPAWAALCLKALTEPPASPGTAGHKCQEVNAPRGQPSNNDL